MKKSVLLLVTVMIFSHLFGCCNQIGKPEDTTMQTTTLNTINTVSKNTTFGNKEALFMNYIEQAQISLQDSYKLYWDSENNHIYQTCNGVIDPENYDVLWESLQLLYTMYNYYEATGDADTKAKIEGEWAFIQSKFPLRRLTVYGRAMNHASDDTGWIVMAILMIYNVTRDAEALHYVHEIIEGAFKHWGDGENCSLGLYYRDEKNYKPDSTTNWKSIYSASLVLSAFEYCELYAGLNGCSVEEVDLFTPAMNIHKWNESNLCRDGVKVYENYDSAGSCTVKVIDYLYYVDYGRDAVNGPNGARNPDHIAIASSCTSLFGNMAMAAINAKLYRWYDDETYRIRALKTAGSITEKESTNDGTYINDRDSGTNSAFVYHYVKYVLMLDGIQCEDIDILAETARVVAENCRFKDNGGYYYYIRWDKNAKASKNMMYQNINTYKHLSRMATCVSMITGAAYAQSLGLITQ